MSIQSAMNDLICWLKCVDVTPAVNLVEEAESPAELVNDLVAQGQLTEYQANQIKLGRRDELVFGEYLVSKQIGSGATGVVYEAFGLGDRRHVAIKVLHFVPSQQQKELTQFLKTVRAATLLKHPHIVETIECGERSGTPYSVMSFVEGTNLAKWLKARTRLSADDAVSIVMQITEGLQYAHEQGICHCDLKPQNLMIEDGNITILDFGAAAMRGLSMDDPSLTTALQSITEYGAGTVPYMSPEQMEETKRDPACDIYAVGIILFELMTGDRPFNEPDLREKIKREYAPSLLRHRQSLLGYDEKLHTQLNSVYLKCVEKLPQHRFASAAELLEELNRIRQRQPIRTRMPSLLQRHLRWCQRNQRQAALTWSFRAAVVACLVVATIGWSVSSNYSKKYRRESERANREADKARAEATRATENEQLAKVEAKRAQDNALRAESQQYRRQLEGAERALREGRLSDVSGELAGPPESQVSWETGRVTHESTLQPFVTRKRVGHEFGVLDVDYDSTGKRLVSCSCDGLLLLWNSDTPKKLGGGVWNDDLRRNESYELLSPDERLNEQGMAIDFYVAACWIGNERVAATSVSGNGFVIDTTTGRAERILAGDTPLTTVAPALDGAILFGDTSGQVHLYADRSLVNDTEVSESGVLCIQPCNAAKKWIVGCEDGTIAVLDITDARLVNRIIMPAPVWSLGVIELGDSTRVVVGCGQPKIQVLELDRDSGALRRLTEMAVPSRNDDVSGVHAVRFSQDGQSVFAIDDRGYFMQWRLDNTKMNWMVAGITRDTRLNRLADKRSPSFRRRGARIIFEDEGQVLTAGEDGVLKTWSTEHTDGITRVKVGRSSRIVFDRTQQAALWALADDGTLSVVDSVSGMELVRQRAHDAPAKALAFVGSKEVATGGADGSIRFWSLAPEKKIQSSREPVLHGAALLSIAVSHNERWIAAVDAKAFLTVWDLRSGKQVFQAKLFHEERRPGTLAPITGQVAFNCDDSHLAAFGSEQSCFVFSTDPFAFVRQGSVAGSGGTAMLWHPEERGFLFFTDDTPRYSEVALDGCSFGIRNLELGAPKSVFIDLESLPNGKRWVWVEASGRLVVVDPVRLGRVFERRTTSGVPVDMSIDVTGRRIAVAHQDGNVEIWETALPNDDAIEAAQDTERWSMVPLVEGREGVWCDGSRCTALDDRRKPCALFLQKAKNWQKDDKGSLYFVRHDENESVVELIADDAEIAPAAVLMMDNLEQPVAIYRRDAATPGIKYLGELCIARRRGPSDWQVTAVTTTGNWGLYPCARARADGSIEAFHHVYGKNWVLSHEGSLTSKVIGQYGDGFEAHSCTDRDGNFHAVFVRHRFSQDPTPPVYARWDGAKWTWEFPHPAATGLSAITCDPKTGEPLVLLSRPKTGGDELILARRGNDGWKHEVLPNVIAPRAGKFAVDGRGNYYLAGADAERLILWTKQQTNWQASVVNEDTPGLQSASVHLSPQGTPILIATGGRIEAPWIRAYVRRDDRGN